MSYYKIPNLIKVIDFIDFLSKMKENSINFVDSKTNKVIDTHILLEQKIIQLKNNNNFVTFKFDDILKLELSCYNNSKIKITNIDSNFIWNLEIKTDKLFHINYDNNTNIIFYIDRAD